MIAPLVESAGAPLTLEERIDAALEDSFPASDAPWWTLGVLDPPDGARDHDRGRHADP